MRNKYETKFTLTKMPGRVHRQIINATGWQQAANLSEHYANEAYYKEHGAAKIISIELLEEGI